MRESNGIFNPSNWLLMCTFDEDEEVINEYYQHVRTDECISVHEYNSLKSEDSI